MKSKLLFLMLLFVNLCFATLSDSLMLLEKYKINVVDVAGIMPTKLGSYFYCKLDTLGQSFFSKCKSDGSDIIAVCKKQVIDRRIIFYDSTNGKADLFFPAQSDTVWLYYGGNVTYSNAWAFDTGMILCNWMTDLPRTNGLIDRSKYAAYDSIGSAVIDADRIAGIPHYSYNYNAASKYHGYWLPVGSPSNISLTNTDFTVDWVMKRGHTPSGSEYILDADYLRDWMIYTDGTKKLGIYICNALLTSKDTIPLVDTRYTITFNKTTKVAQLWKNGVKDSSKTMPTVPSYWSGSLKIGGRSDQEAANKYVGTISMVHLYDVALDSTRISNIQQNLFTPYTVVGYGSAQPANTITVQPQNKTINDFSPCTLSVTATGTGPTHYQWRKASSNVGTDANKLIFTAAYADNGVKYCVLVTDDNGTTVSDTAVVTVNKVTPIITVQPQPQTVNDYSSCTFSVTATSGLPETYYWRRAGVTIPGATSSSYTFTPAYMDSGINYSVVIKNASDSVISSNALLTVHSIAAVITSQPSSIQRFIGQTATFSVSAYGTGTLTYQWKRNGVNISSATSSSYTTPTLDTSYNNAQYTCIIANSKGTTTSAIATLSMSHGPSINVQPQSITVNSGVLCTLSVTVTATGTPHYQWRKGNSNVGTDNRLYIFTSTYADSGSKYCVLINDDIANSVSDTAIVSVNKVLPTISVQPQSQTVYAGSYVTFNVTASNASSYQWRKNGSAITGATSSSYGPFLALIGDSGSKYMVVLTNSDGTKGSDTALLVVNTVPIDTAAEPFVESVSPKTIYYGTIINITGLDLGGIQGTLYCDSIPLSLITYWSDTLIHVTAPSNIPTGLHSLIVVKASGASDTLISGLYIVNYSIQKLVGTVRNIDGTVPADAKIVIKPKVDNLSQSVALSSQPVQIRVDTNGYWETNVICGSKLDISIVVGKIVISKKSIVVTQSPVKDYFTYYDRNL